MIRKLLLSITEASTGIWPVIINALASRLIMTKILSNDLEISRQEEIKALQQRIRCCRLCQEYGYIPKARPLVNARPDDRIMAFGQAPGHRSIAKGRSFNGPVFTTLQKWLYQPCFTPSSLHSHTP